ncbi:MAG: hypothetical protein ACFBSC_17660 [Microcoleaceae cyanobacterium]
MVIKQFLSKIHTVVILGLFLTALPQLNSNFDLNDDFLCALTAQDRRTILYVTQEEKSRECLAVCQQIAPTLNQEEIHCFFEGKELELGQSSSAAPSTVPEQIQPFQV